MPGAAARPRPTARVDAVLVACDGQRWLPETLAALAAQTRAPDAVVTVDAGSTDASPQLLAAAGGPAGSLPGSRAVQVRRRTGFADGVRAALVLLDAARLAGEDAGAGRAWVWLLHDDSAPDPDALARLLAAVEVAPSVGVAGCKAVEWHDPGLLQQAGFSTTLLGRRLTGVDPGDRDQGQRDDRSDVLAVSTAGMLVRRDLLDALGTDPALAVLGEDLDLCRRARLAGARVVVVPGAVVRHADATRTRQRDTPVAEDPRWTARRQEAHARLAGAPALLLLPVLLSVLAGGVVRALTRVAAKQPDLAPAELSAVLAAACSPRRLLRARRAAARTARLPRRTLRPLLVPRKEVWRWHHDRWARQGWAPPLPPRGLAGAPGAAPTAEDAAALLPAPRAALDDAAEPEAPSRRGLAVLVPLLLALTAADVTALHRLVGAGAVTGGALAPAPTLLALWHAARSTWQSAGLGAAAPADPWLSVLAVLSVPAGGSPATAVLLLLLLALPLAAWGAWTATGAATRSVPLRAAVALAWAGAPSLLLAVQTGRLGALAAHLALPWVALGTARAVGAPTRRRALTAAAGAGLAAAVAIAGAPVLLPALLLALLVVAATARRWGAALAWVALAPLAVVGPLLTPALGDLRVLAAAPGLPVAGAPAAPWQQLLAVPSALGAWAGPQPLLALVPAAVLLVPAVTGGTRRGVHGRAGRIGAWLVGLGLATAVGASRTVVAPAGGVAALGWAGPGTSLLLLGLVLAALGWAAPASARTGRSARAGRSARLATAGVTLVVLTSTALVGAWTASQLGPAGRVLVRDTTPVSAVAQDGADSSAATRTLHLRLGAGGAVEAGVSRGAPTLADASAVRAAASLTGPPGAPRAVAPDAAGAALEDVAARLAAGGPDPRAQLAGLGVGYVLVDTAGPPAAAAAGAVSTPLDAVAGLERAGATRAGVLYRVLPAAGPTAVPPARARLVAADGTALAALPSAGTGVSADVPAGAAGRTVVLAERADAGWHARLDGRPLRSVTAAGWAQAFEVPAAGGHLTVTRTDPQAAAWAALQGLVLLLTVLLAVPVPSWGRREGRTP